MPLRKRRRDARAPPRAFPPAGAGEGAKRRAGRSTERRRFAEGFWETHSKEEDSLCGQPLKADRQLVQSASSTAHSKQGERQESVLIQWSSSDSELSDCEPKPPATNAVTRRRLPCYQPVHQSYSSYLRMITTAKQPQEGEFENIEWDSDSSDHDGSVEISDCDSITEEQGDSAEPFLGDAVDISDRSSGPDTTASVTPARCDMNSEQPGRNVGRSASDWVRCVQALLKTPPKQEGRRFRTPEDSAKKKRKFLRGGLAERLSKLQSRQRSAVSFWRHQSSYSTHPGTNPSALVLEMLSVQEECGLQLALCRPLETHLTSRSLGGASEELLVLFSKDTAVHLLAGPGDTVCVFPPWQKLTLKDQSHTVILNTHFSQRLVHDSKVVVGIPRAAPAVCPLYPLTRLFSLTDRSDPAPQKTPTASPVPPRQCRPALREAEADREVCNSLLEVTEARGRADWSARHVQVVVQRVYCLNIADPSSPILLKNRGPQSTSQAQMMSQPSSRVCLLVQDSCGVFSEVQLHDSLADDGNLRRYASEWEGQRCVLRGVKVVQRLTRARSPWLFSLIDSLWPPATPPQARGASQGSWEDPAKLQAPAFCYVLSADHGERAVQVAPGQPSDELYQPAVAHSLKEILQGVPHSQRCTFTATVVHKRLKSTDPGQSEFWLFVTDSSLQTGQEGEQQRTVPVYVSSSCVLLQEVARTLSQPSACRLTFKDVVKEHDAVLCVERSLLQLEPLRDLDPSLIQLDQLGPTTATNTLCTLRGVIVSVDEGTASSWPTCTLCDSDRLEKAPGNQQEFLCGLCGATVDKPAVKMHLEVFLSCPPLSQCTVKVKLLQDTIKSVLNSAACGQEGYEVENVLGVALGPLAAYVRVVSRQPTFWMSLEEISL
ncbi:DNA repair-scaffolding protein isoform X1 [Arapaima gigas]